MLYTVLPLCVPAVEHQCHHTSQSLCLLHHDQSDRRGRRTTSHHMYIVVKYKLNFSFSTGRTNHEKDWEGRGRLFSHWNWNGTSSQTYTHYYGIHVGRVGLWWPRQKDVSPVYSQPRNRVILSLFFVSCCNTLCHTQDSVLCQRKLWIWNHQNHEESGAL